MRPDDFRDFLKAEPFRPFRVTLTDGRTYEVFHPELAMVGRSTVTIGLVPPGVSEPIYDRLVTIALVHVMQLDHLESVTF